MTTPTVYKSRFLNRDIASREILLNIVDWAEKVALTWHVVAPRRSSELITIYI